MKIILRTLTPLWTGGVDGKVDRIHETSILGSLRWWYEALVRGLGGRACDPSQAKCAFDAEKYARSKAIDERQRLLDAGLCDVCQVFGATGWQRRFRLEIWDTSLRDASIQDTVELHKDGRTARWYFREKPKEGSFSITVKSLFSDMLLEVIAGLLQFVSDWAALGARPQMGFGVIKPERGRIDTKPFYDWITTVSGERTYHDLPSLQNMFFARILPEGGSSFTEDTEEETFNLKYDLRRLFANNRDLRHFIMGTVKGKRLAAKVKMSRPYEHDDKSTIRVWGWIPEQANEYRNDWNRKKVIEEIHKHLDANYRLEVWREMNSSRDTVTPNNANVLAFLQSLLDLEGENNAP